MMGNCPLSTLVHIMALLYTGMNTLVICVVRTTFILDRYWVILSYGPSLNLCYWSCRWKYFLFYFETEGQHSQCQLNKPKRKKTHPHWGEVGPLGHKTPPRKRHQDWPLPWTTPGPTMPRTTPTPLAKDNPHTTGTTLKHRLELLTTLSFPIPLDM